MLLKIDSYMLTLTSKTGSTTEWLMAEAMKQRGLVIGREGCDFPPGKIKMIIIHEQYSIFQFELSF